MSFNFYLQKGFRLLLFPFSLLVWAYIRVRNWLYKIGVFKTTTINMPLICVGNLSVGGTGKSPMVEYLLGLLHTEYKLATISRGYKRKTKGYVLANAKTTALEIGDEPMQFHSKFPMVAVAVGEARIEAIPQLLHDEPDTEVIVLDDAFQHRQIIAGLNILLTEYANPYWNDWYLPTGDLRDNKRSAARAEIIVVTKCPPELTIEQKNQCIKQITPHQKQAVFFTTIAYGIPYHLVQKTPFHLHAELEVLLVCGIANPLPLKAFIEKNTTAYFQKSFEDHHVFSIDDWKDIEERFKKLSGNKNIILTTEKDAVRLEKFNELLQHKPIYVLPIKHEFLFDEGAVFNASIVAFIKTYSKKPL